MFCNEPEGTFLHVKTSFINFCYLNSNTAYNSIDLMAHIIFEQKNNFTVKHCF